MHCRLGGFVMGDPGCILLATLWNSMLTLALHPFAPPALLSSRRYREERLRLRHATESRNPPVGPPPPLPPPPPPNPNGAGSDHAANRIGGAWQAGVVGVGVAAASGSRGGSVADEGRGRRGAGAAAARQLEVSAGARLFVWLIFRLLFYGERNEPKFVWSVLRPAHVLFHALFRPRIPFFSTPEVRKSGFPEFSGF